MNPYARFLGSLNPLDVIAATSERLASLVQALGAEGAERPTAPGKWNARQILCHLADCEMVFGYRLRQTLAEDHHVIQPFDQDVWAEHYSAYTTAEALQLFSTMRQWNIALLKHVGPAANPKAVTHPERGSMTFQTIVETMAGHDINHISQIEAAAAQTASA